MIVARHVNDSGLLSRFFKLVTFLINCGVVFFACRSFSYRNSKLLYKIYAGYWMFQVTLVLLYTLMRDVQRNNFSMGDLIVFLNHIIQLLSHIVLLLESFTMDPKRYDIELNFTEFEKRFINEFGKKVANGNENKSHHGRIIVIAVFGILLVSTLHILIKFTDNPKIVLSSVIYWHTLLSSLALQFRILEVLVNITALNEYANLLCCQINEIGEQNLSKLFGLQSVIECTSVMKDDIIWVKPHIMPDATTVQDVDEERKLCACKRFYGDIYNMFKIINDHFGWSLFAFIIKYHIYIVIHSYWIVSALVVNNKNKELLQNMGDLVFAVQFLWVMCWQSQNCQEQSSQIRCIMFKVVKPKGKRSYKDLVTDFSLQTLHQQYTMTAKRFFNLNLNLLGSIAAGVVTYLVILVQFMLAEKSKADRASKNSAATHLKH